MYLVSVLNAEQVRHSWMQFALFDSPRSQQWKEEPDKYECFNFGEAFETMMKKEAHE